MCFQNSLVVSISPTSGERSPGFWLSWLNSCVVFLIRRHNAIVPDCIEGYAQLTIVRHKLGSRQIRIPIHGADSRPP
jgi:hypothetical protein